MAMTEEVGDALHLGQLIDGRQVSGPRLLEVRNPGRLGELVGTIADGTPAEVDAAVAAASRAAPGWAATTPAARVALLARIADTIDAAAESLTDLVVRENGSARSIVRREVMGAAAAFRGVADYLVSKLSPVDHASGPGEAFVRVTRRPFGVVACIVPWNAPLILTANKLAPAIAAGNAVVLKPSPFAPLGVSRVAMLAAEILPPGVINVVNGGAEVGGALVGHRLVRKVSFTGGGATARHIMRQAADRLTGVHFELGGNDPAVVLDDADLATSAERIAESAFRRAGQVCFAVKRVYVPRPLLAEFTAHLVDHVDRIVVGDPLDERTTMGPLNNAGQRERVEHLRRGAEVLGRDVRVLGTRLSPERWRDGHYLQPMLVLDAEHDDELVREEQFGPILPVIAYDEQEDAIAMANDTEYGLCASVWSRSIERAAGVATRIESGMVILNNHLFSPAGTAAIPFGGWKQSGIGWEASPYGIDEYLQFHSIDAQPPGDEA